MNKTDIKLIIVILIIVIILIIVQLLNKTKANVALVYYESDIILTIDLSIDKEYTVKGANGDVIIQVLDNKIKVKEENSNYHLCSKQGYISNSNESIVCLPNKIIIELPNSDIDTEVR